MHRKPRTEPEALLRKAKTTLFSWVESEDSSPLSILERRSCILGTHRSPLQGGTWPFALSALQGVHQAANIVSPQSETFIQSPPDSTTCSQKLLKAPFEVRASMSSTCRRWLGQWLHFSLENATASKAPEEGGIWGESGSNYCELQIENLGCFLHFSPMGKS